MDAMVATGEGIKQMEEWEELKKYPELMVEILDHCMSSPKRRRVQ